MANIYCENYNCKNYFEDMCMLERIKINNLKVCESYIEGKNELYELEKGYTMHPKDLKILFAKSEDYSVEVTHIQSGITVKCCSENSFLKNKNKCLEILEEELIKINSCLELKDLR
ncbi:peptide chain release factor-like protein [Clostridioides difficile]|uniref:peptide chain release factor family protein n=1 Tax=Clostridioides difficile TaxID=1496 RepID=UPI00093F4839|nr:peptide chain release factor-like protein [Clostridioides difficile]EGT4823275.1 peptide chain release factor-like protein [Clostridioides difficile]EGT5247479.1 peptide chain release factor-like protein [Clostridioides difficile]MBF9873614.1 peptide chain release factor-like protein [Clostridioides difficile]MBG0097531.1 peptide chain release factor-like protein [Clostridioides difficile]MBG0206432.1 peptide chain release factor-like protein [Clostridioides difficile]